MPSSMNYINQLENKNSFPPPKIIDKLAAALKIRPRSYSMTACPENIIGANRDTFIAMLAARVHERLQADSGAALARRYKRSFRYERR